MKNQLAPIYCSKYLKLFSALLIAGSVLVPAQSRAADEYSPGYQYDMRGNVVRDADGNCLRTAQWTPADAIAVCDPGVVGQRDEQMPVRGTKGRVTGVEATVDLLVLQAGKTFPFDSAELSEQGKKLLAAAAETHKNVYIHRVIVTGYTDKIGNDEYNLELSKRRADAVKADLVTNGIPEERIRVDARGSDDPLVSCPGLAGEALIRCLAPNRRVEVRFIIPVVTTDAAVELVASRRQEKIKEKNIKEEAVAYDAPIITQGMNDAVKIVVDGCSKEIANFCGDVPLGGGRVLNCLYSYSPQLSSGCQDAIKQGESTIEAALGNANFFGAQCGSDINRFCAGVNPGGGQLLACLMDNINNVERRCYLAMREIGLFSD
jgi:OmpA-OmpF porin, OOP family